MENNHKTFPVDTTSGQALPTLTSSGVYVLSSTLSSPLETSIECTTGKMAKRVLTRANAKLQEIVLGISTKVSITLRRMRKRLHVPFQDCLKNDLETQAKSKTTSNRNCWLAFT